jgi:hypothetical protein
MRSSLGVLASLALLFALVPVAAAAGPVRNVINLADPALDADESAWLSEECGFPVKAVNAGHIIEMTFPAGRRTKTQINVYGIRATYTNLDSGVSVKLVDAGPDRFYTKGGRLYVAVTGRSTTGTGTIGVVVFDLETDEIVHESGKEVGIFWDSICDRLGA